MSSTCKQRYFGENKENEIKYKFCGQTRLFQVCLNYQGSQSPLTCSIDGDNLRNVAIKAGVKDIVSLYDNGETPLHPTKLNVLSEFSAMAQRCQPGDILVFQYSGHGSRVEDKDGDEEDGYDQILCLTNENGENQDLTDDELAQMVGNEMNPVVPILFLMDCCHSGTILDLQKPGLWKKGRKVISISGCQDNQLSGDTGNGGVMTNALLQVLQSRSCKKRRKNRSASIQFVFNRMVQKMPEEQLQGQGQQEMMEEDEEWIPEWEEDEQGQYQYQWDIEEQPEEFGEEQIQEGQVLNLSWNGGTDPINISFPF